MLLTIVSDGQHHEVKIRGRDTLRELKRSIKKEIPQIGARFDVILKEKVIEAGTSLKEIGTVDGDVLLVNRRPFDEFNKKPDKTLTHDTIINILQQLSQYITLNKTEQSVSCLEDLFKQTPRTMLSDVIFRLPSEAQNCRQCALCIVKKLRNRHQVHLFLSKFQKLLSDKSFALEAVRLSGDIYWGLPASLKRDREVFSIFKKRRDVETFLYPPCRALQPLCKAVRTSAFDFHKLPAVDQLKSQKGSISVQFAPLSILKTVAESATADPTLNCLLPLKNQPRNPKLLRVPNIGEVKKISSNGITTRKQVLPSIRKPRVRFACVEAP